MPAEERRRSWTDYARASAVHADTAILQSLAHPLRQRLLGLLRLDGPSTATKLAAQVNESSGLTSYHLRQLASAGLVTEADPADLVGIPQSGGRERWWKAAHQSTVWDMPGDDDEAGQAAMEDFLRVALATQSASVQAWLSEAHSWPREWRDASDISDVSMRLTVEEMRQFNADIAEVISRYRASDPAVTPKPGTAVVKAQLRVFPHPDQEPPSD